MEDRRSEIGGNVARPSRVVEALVPSAYARAASLPKLSGAFGIRHRTRWRRWIAISERDCPFSCGGGCVNRPLQRFAAPTLDTSASRAHTSLGSARVRREIPGRDATKGVYQIEESFMLRHVNEDLAELRFASGERIT